jgi:hypothetical protein
MYGIYELTVLTANRLRYPLVFPVYRIAPTHGYPGKVFILVDNRHGSASYRYTIEYRTHCLSLQYRYLGTVELVLGTFDARSRHCPPGTGGPCTPTRQPAAVLPTTP